MSREEKTEKDFQKMREMIGSSPAVDLFLSKYAKTNTRSTYLMQLTTYFRWLKDEKKITLSPDELVKDNLNCLFKSQDPTDVVTKARHLNLMNEYVNAYLLRRDFSESKRKLAVTAITQFYRRNNSILWGDFDIATQRAGIPPKPLEAEEIRKVLLSMTVRYRTPLLVSWQSSIEINRVLTMKYPELSGAPPFKIELYGRKGHRKPYWTYIGQESAEHLKMIADGGMPAYASMLMAFKEAAKRLFREGLIKNGDKDSWHPHALRHSFSTECAHAKVIPEIREFWMGHVQGVSFVYQHPELHEDDMLNERRKVEPYLSLEATRVSLKEESDARERTLLSKFLQLEKNYEELKKEVRGFISAN